MAGTYTRHVSTETNGKFTLDKWTRLTRFLILGTEGGTFYANEREHTLDNVAVVAECIAADPTRTVNEAIRVSEAGLAKSNEPAIYVMAMTSMYSYSLENMYRVCRTSTHLFIYMDMIKKLKPRGFGTALRRAIAAWYENKTDDQVAYQLVKYRQRNGWTHRDVMMHGRPRPREVYKYVKKDAEIDLMKISTKAGNLLRYTDIALHSDNVEEVISCIHTAQLPWESLPTKMLNDPAIWHALFATNSVGYIAALRNIKRIFEMGDASLSNWLMDYITNPVEIRKSRVHPIQILNAWAMNNDNKTRRDLEGAFQDSFQNVKPTGERILVALDVSGSMDSRFGGGVMTAREASTAVATVIANTETNVNIVGFSQGITPLQFYPSFYTNIATTSSLPFSATDCSLPIAWAAENQLKFDAFVVLTDSETNAHRQTPAEVLKRYRKFMDVNAKLIVCATTATRFSIADPSDPGMLDIAGFSPDVPRLISEFIRGW
jgi:60 kDa SS-A/Ro ribonucleoprotein